MNFETMELSFQVSINLQITMGEQTQEVHESMKLENDMNRAKNMPSLTIQAMVLM